MTFALSQRSLGRLDGVHPKLVEVVKQAITITKVDFGVTEGLRTLETQRNYVATGKSQTMDSYHLPQADGYGYAVDLVAYVGGQVSWEMNLYDDIADAIAQAARNVGVGMVWGAAWHIDDIRKWNGTMEDATLAYIDLRRSQGRRPFLDGPHFQMHR